ncbi:phage minor head protein [Hyphomicrobium sp. CS1GBMeth3]|uniref:phage minor head protein n=1 Tax=Hyphomicrobium sp. CS1GBMeth3 TaxID=1892845 RepID=UPI000930AA4F|nr:phage minor head protein [Hyphomicrobium sp. CS1GBMeth3]
MISSILKEARGPLTEVIRQEREAYAAANAGVPIQIGDDIGGRIRAILEGLRETAERAAAAAEDAVRRTMRRESVRHMRRWVGSIRTSTSIDVGALVSEADMVELLSVRSEEFARLIRNVSEDVRTRIAQETIRAITEGRTNENIARSLTQIEGIGRGRAKLIARDQASKLNAAMNEFRQRQAGITKYKWRSMMDPPRARENHMDRNDKIFEWSKPPSDGHPGHAINCRCRALAVLE